MRCALRAWEIQGWAIQSRSWPAKFQKIAPIVSHYYKFPLIMLSCIVLR